MKSRSLKFLLVLSLLLGGALTTLPAHSCEPLLNCIPPKPDPTIPQPKVPGKTIHPQVFRLVANSLSKFKEVWVGGNPVAAPAPAAASTAAAANGCDQPQPDSYSCHGWWASSKQSVYFSAWPHTHQYDYYWRIVFWTDAGNKKVTKITELNCRIYRDWYYEFSPCTTGHTTTAMPTMDWWQNYYVGHSLCPKSPSPSDDGWIDAHVNNQHQVWGTWYIYSYYRYC